MQLQIDGQGLNVTAALKDVLQKKLDRLTSHFDMITNAHIVFKVNKIRQIAEGNLNVPGSAIFAKAESDDMYKTIDMLLEKLKVQLTKYKDSHVHNS